MCETLGKTAVEVPDTPGFVVNRLLFPYLFAAVDLPIMCFTTTDNYKSLQVEGLW